MITAVMIWKDVDRIVLKLVVVGKLFASVRWNKLRWGELRWRGLEMYNQYPML
jgi:hypothetical protein